MMKRSKLIISILSSVIAIGIIVILLNLTYSVNDITADNYRSKLKAVDNLSIPNEVAGLRYFFDNTGVFFQSEQFQSSDRYDVSKTELNRGGGYLTTIIDRVTGDYYVIRHLTPSGIVDYMSIEKKPTPSDILPAINNWQEKINYLIQNEEFIYKKTDLIKGSDIIMKDLGSSFIIGNILKTNNNEPGIIMFQLYSKKKFSF